MPEISKDQMAPGTVYVPDLSFRAQKCTHNEVDAAARQNIARHLQSLLSQRENVERIQDSGVLSPHELDCAQTGEKINLAKAKKVAEILGTSLACLCKSDPLPQTPILKS